MAQVPASERYTRTAVVLHWLVAVLILVNVALGLTAESLPDDWIRPAIDAHKSTGITVLGLVLLRLLWRIGHPPPRLPRSYARWERIGAQVAHGALYALMLLPAAAVGLAPRLGLEGRVDPSDAALRSL